MRCVVAGATGYLGARLVPELLSAGHDVRVMARTPAKLDDVPWRGRVEVVEGDVTDAEQVRRALDGQQVLYYLVHSMLGKNFVDVDARGASIVATAAAQAGLTRIVYVGGIIPDQQQLSEHLASRAEVGRLLHESGVPTAELRAAVIIGAGSASFEMLRYLTERLPLMVTPKWLRTRVQPIAVRDVLYYLTHAAELPADVSRAFDIGGPDAFTYTEMSRRYAAIAGLRKRVAIPVPVLTPRLSSHWVNLITPLPRSLASSLMDSLENDVVCTENDIAVHIPDPENGLTHYKDAVELALAWVSDGELATRWSRDGADDHQARPLPTDPDWAGGSLHEHRFERRVDADAETLWGIFESIGAKHGWSAAPSAWALRGWIGLLGGTATISRGSPQLHRLNSGEALDWWRIEHVDRPRLLRLRADAPLPGRLWLELSVHDDVDSGSTYRQRALFQPYGLAGEALWTASTPLRHAVFGGIAHAIISAVRGAALSART
jgi:uncharacterized protein YbjT (DUF2867 family)